MARDSDRILFFFTRFVFTKKVQSNDEIEFHINNTLLCFIIIIMMIIVLMLTRRDDKSLFVSCFINSSNILYFLKINFFQFISIYLFFYFIYYHFIYYSVSIYFYNFTYDI